MVSDRQLRRSKRVQRRTGRTFHLATRLFPERVRHPTYVLYAFFRVADEVVDGATDLSPAEERQRLERLRDAALGRRKTDDPVLAAFNEVREEHGIPDGEIVRFVDAMLTDTEKSRYRTREELSSYTRGSAAAVGVMMQAVMGVDDPDRARPHAVALGEAFQLTNFLRDVREDILDHGRVYLPGTVRERHGVTEDQLRNCEPTPGFRAAMAEELRRTERKYREGVAGIRHLPADCQFAVLFAAVLYAEHHRLIRAREYDVLTAPPELGALRAARLWAATRWHWQWSDDPETVFRRVSAVPDGDRSAGGTDLPGGAPQAE